MKEMITPLIYKTKKGEVVTILPRSITIGYEQAIEGERVYNPKTENPLFYLMRWGEGGAVEAMLEANPALRKSYSCNGYSMDDYNSLYSCGMERLLEAHSKVVSPIIEHCKAALSSEEVEVVGSVDKSCDAASPADDL